MESLVAVIYILPLASIVSISYTWVDHAGIVQQVVNLEERRYIVLYNQQVLPSIRKLKQTQLREIYHQQ